MKIRYAILSILLFMPVLASAQLQIRTHKEKISDFLQKSTKVVMTGNDSLDIPVRQALKDFWTISAYELCSEEEFESLRSGDSYYFLVVGDGNDGLRYWHLVKGGSYDKRKGLASMLTVATIPICPADGFTGREDYLLPVLVCCLQNMAARAVSSNYTGIGGKSAPLKKSAGLPLYLCEEELSPAFTAADKELCEEKNISILTSLHDLSQALELGDRFFFMKDGQIRHAGGAEIVTEDVIFETFDAEVRIVEIEGKKIIINGGRKT